MARTRLFHPWGREPEGGGVRLRRSVSHVVGHGHMLTSDRVPLGHVGARQGPTGVRMGPDLGRTPIRVHQVIRQGPSAPVGHIGHIGQSSVRSKNIKFNPKWVENRPFGPKQRPNESYGLSGPIRTTPETKNGPNKIFFKGNGPRRHRWTPFNKSLTGLGGPQLLSALIDDGIMRTSHIL